MQLIVISAKIVINATMSLENEELITFVKTMTAHFILLSIRLSIEWGERMF